MPRSGGVDDRHTPNLNMMFTIALEKIIKDLGRESHLIKGGQAVSDEAAITEDAIARRDLAPSKTRMARSSTIGSRTVFL